MTDNEKLSFQLGILGGMGPYATAKILEEIIRLTDARSDAEHIPVLICNDPRIPDRTAAICRGETSPLKMLYQVLDFLNQSNVSLIIMPCNTSHYYFDLLQSRSAAPIINMVETTIRYTENKFKNKTICCLCTKGTVQAKVYERYLSKRNSMMELSDNAQHSIMDVIYNMKAGVNTELCGQQLVSIMQSIATNIDPVFIYGCTELSILRDYVDSRVDYKTIDANEVLAASSIITLGYKIKETETKIDVESLSQLVIGS